MKQYLLITPWCPYPPHKNGGVHTTYNIIKNKPDDVIIDIIYYYEKQDKQAELALAGKLREVKCFCSYNVPNSVQRLASLLTGKPDMICGMNVKSNVTDLIKQNKYDVIILDQIFSLEFLKFIPNGVPIISMMHDSQILMYRSKAKTDHSFIKKLYDKMQCMIFEKYEKKRLRRCRKIIYVSNDDMNFSKSIYKEIKDRFDNITLGVDIPDKSSLSTPQSHHLVFSGVMDYDPNEDAALYFVNEIFPKLLEVYPDSVFTIAGKNPTDSIKKISNNNIEVTGFVDDMVATITQSEIYVSPLRFGSGTKNKILEAMVAGMPVLLSPISRDGIEGLVDGVNCIFVDDNNQWIDKISMLFEDEALKNTISDNAKSFVMKEHSWERVFDKFLV